MFSQKCIWGLNRDTAMQRPHSIRVALVDDDSYYRDMFVSAVQGHSALWLDHVACSGHEMLHWLQDHCPDVLLVDLGLPDVPGLDIVKFGASRWPQLNIAVVTLFSDAPHVMACLEAGAMGYVLKQSVGFDVTNAILEIHNGGAPMSPGIARYVLQRLQQTGSAAVLAMPEPCVDVVHLLKSA